MIRTIREDQDLSDNTVLHQLRDRRSECLDIREYRKVVIFNDGVQTQAWTLCEIGTR